MQIRIHILRHSTAAAIAAKVAGRLPSTVLKSVCRVSVSVSVSDLVKATCTPNSAMHKVTLMNTLTRIIVPPLLLHLSRVRHTPNDHAPRLRLPVETVAPHRSPAEHILRALVHLLITLLPRPRPRTILAPALAPLLPVKA